MEGDDYARRQLRQAMEALKPEHGPRWLEVVAEQVVDLGGGDAVDLLHLALDEALFADEGEGGSGSDRN